MHHVTLVARRRLRDSSCRRAGRRLVSAVALAALTTLLAACGPQLKYPASLVSPYSSTRLFAVAPPLNESGVSAVDTIRVAELFTEELEQVDGIRTVPVNRVLTAMRSLGLERVDTRGDALALMGVLGADGLVVGTISGWDPYNPPLVGMAVSLFTRTGPGSVQIDPREVAMSIRGGRTEVGDGAAPSAQASGVFNAANHTTLRSLALYAQGRAEPQSSFAEDIYLVSIDAYTRFVSYELILELLQSEATQMGLPPTSVTLYADDGRSYR